MYLKVLAITLLGSGIGLTSVDTFAAKPAFKASAKPVLSDEVGIKLAAVSWYVERRDKKTSAVFYLRDRTPSGGKAIKKLVAEASKLYPDLKFFDDAENEELGRLYKSGAHLFNISIYDIQWNSKVDVDLYTHRLVDTAVSTTIELTLKKIKGKWKVVDSNVTGMS